MLECFVQTPGLLNLFSGIIILGLYFYLGRYGTRSNTIVWFRTFLFLSFVYSVTSSFMQCSQTNAMYSFWLNASDLAAILLIPVELIFTLHFINKPGLTSKSWFRLVVLWGTIGYIALHWGTDLVHIHDINLAVSTWGYHPQVVGPLQNVAGLVYMLGYGVPVALTIWYYRHLQDPAKRKEVRLVMIALLLVVLPGLLIEGLIPAIFHISGPPVAWFFNVIVGGMIVYAITRYGLHVFSLNDITSNLVDVMPGGLIVLDHTNTIQYINHGAANMLGYNSGQLAGASAKKLFASVIDYGNFQTKVLSQLTPTHQVSGFEATLATKRKTALPVSLNAVSVYYGHELINKLVTFTDITKLKLAEAQLKEEKNSVERKVTERTGELARAQAQLTASIRSLPFGFAVINRQNEVMFSNELLHTLLNHPIPAEAAASHAALEAINKTFAEVIDLLGCIAEAQSTARPIERNIAFGPRFYRFFFRPVLEEKRGKTTALGTVLLVEDTTEAKALERSRDEFFSIASHELRTPLTAIRGNSQMILDYYGDQLKDPSLHGMVQDIHDSGARLIAIVNDFLDVSRLEQNKSSFKVTDFNIAAVAQQTLREYDVTGSRRKLSLNLEIPHTPLPLVRADADRTRQILINLLGNGIKYTDKGGVTITITADKSWMKIQVADTGTGIPVESQHLLFHKFQQATDSILTRDNTQSTGLGLYIARLLAEGMGGKLYLEKSEVGKGSTFTLELPRGRQ